MEFRRSGSSRRAGSFAIWKGPGAPGPRSLSAHALYFQGDADTEEVPGVPPARGVHVAVVEGQADVVRKPPGYPAVLGEAETGAAPAPCFQHEAQAKAEENLESQVVAEIESHVQRGKTGEGDAGSTRAEPRGTVRGNSPRKRY